MTNRILELITRNFWYKVLSLFLAVVVWGIIQGEQIYEVNREVLVNLTVPEGYALRGERLRTKAVTIRGPRVWMLELPDLLEANISVPAFEGQSFKIRLDKSKLKQWNDRLQLVVHDPYVEGFVDLEVERTVPIKEILQGTPASGYLIERVLIKPRFVTLRGVNADLIRIRQVVTEPIDISGIKQSKLIDAKLIAPGVKAEAMSIDSAEVQLKVGDSRVNKRFGNIPIEIIGNRYQTSVKPEDISVMVQGTPSVLNFVATEDFKAFVEVEGLAPGRYELDVRLKIPSDTILIDVFPEKAIVSVSKKLN